MNRDRRYLTKSRYVAGLQCQKRLWLQVHEPLPSEPSPPASLFDLGREVGELAHRLFPGGVLVDAAPWEHAEACRRTIGLMRAANVPAIFEAAFEADNIRIRVDILERLSIDRWGLREVKMSTSVKDSHLDDLAIQLHVMRRCGLDLPSVELIHIDNSYVRGKEIDPVALFARTDCCADTEERLVQVGDLAVELQAQLLQRAAPEIAPSAHCHSPYSCEYWERCTVGKPEDWVLHLPGARRALLDTLAARGIERIGEIPDDLPLSAVQTRVRASIRQGGLVVEPGLAKAIAWPAPTSYLDFETLGPPIPVYPGTRPYEVIPMQWSMHIDTGTGALRHRSFLAEGLNDPRRTFAETLLKTVEAVSGEIIVYSGFEQRCLLALAKLFPDLTVRLGRAVSRFVDLLPIVRAYVAHPSFHGSFSIKDVAPILASDVTYDDLDEVRDGEQASGALYLLATGRTSDPAHITHLRSSLERYCARDTEALAAVFRVLKRFAARS